ncbi:hypothetical protein MFUL124B02_24535 [Myxococcus fulvus 124B02]|nr:hypothetical protein MFUL124B02_24535 [Myxococcus fulvus 124B02]
MTPRDAEYDQRCPRLQAAGSKEPLIMAFEPRTREGMSDR